MIAEAAFYGGAKDQTTGSAVTVNFTLYRVHTVSTTSAGLNIKLQSARQLKTGGVTGVVVNAGANSFNLIDNSNNLLLVMAAGDSAVLGLIDNTTAAGSWIVRSGTANFVADPPVNLYFYVVGGFPSGTYDHSAREYDSQLDVWAQRSDMPAPVASQVDNGAAVYGTAGYYVGSDDGNVSASNHKRIYQYDPDVWTNKTSGTVRWGGSSGAVVGTSIVWFNGSVYDSWNTGDYSVGGDSWTARTSRTAGSRASPTITGSANSKAVLLDGASNAVDTYVVDTWTAKTARPGASARLCSAASKSNVCYVYGGNEPAILANVYTYTESTDTWASLSSMSSGRVDAAACSIGSYNYLAGGKLASAGTAVNGSTATVTNANWEHAVGADTYIARSVVSPTSGSPTGVYDCVSQGAAITP